MILSGLFMVESASRLRIKLEGPGENFDLPLWDTGDQASVRFTSKAHTRRMANGCHQPGQGRFRQGAHHAGYRIALFAGDPDAQHRYGVSRQRKGELG